MRAIVVVGMGMGDEGKGSIVDYLVREHKASTVVRFNGGAQAAHRVVLADGRSHVFSQFGSGTFVPGVKTYLSRWHMFNPATLLNEHFGLCRVGIRDAMKRLFVDADCPVTTPFHVAANQLNAFEQDATGGRHGTTGMGIGETAKDILAGVELRVKDMSSPNLVSKLCAIQERKRQSCSGLGAITNWRGNLLDDRAAPEELARLYRVMAQRLNIVDWYEFEGTTIFEGAQGALLDERYGFSPHTTWSNTLTDNALAIIRSNFDVGDDAWSIGVIRAYATRHGEGPLPTQAPLPLPEPMVDRRWAGAFRVGYTDLVTARYAADISPVDALAVTCVDRIPYPWQVCVSYKGGALDPLRFIPTDSGPVCASYLMSAEPMYESVDEPYLPYLIAETMNLPLHIISTGPTAEDKMNVPLLTTRRPR